MLLIHGGRDHCRNWDWVAQDLRGDYHIIAPDLRGHGDSQWMLGGNYSMVDYVADIAQLVHQKQETPITIIGHSLGGSISLQYAGVYPENVVKVVAIEGLGPSPAQLTQRGDRGPGQRMREWIKALREFAGRNAAPLPVDRTGREAHAAGQPAPVPRAGDTPDGARGQPERGRHL